MADNPKKNPHQTANPQKGDPNTTGHSWDGIEEFDNPMPRWWVWSFILCVIFAMGYWVFYPAWPGINKATTGVLGYASRNQVAKEIATFEARNDVLFAQILETEPAELAQNEDLHRFAVNAGASVFKAQCSQCHGAGGGGVQAGGFPSLLDDDWLWGGKPADIVQTVTYGIRNEDYPDARYSQMPSFGRDGLLTEDEIRQAANFVLSLSGADHDAELASAGAEVFDYNCSACHGPNGGGNQDLGAPALNDQIWLYGGSEQTVYESIYNARFGVMPGFTDRLREGEVRAVAAYVHQLGGGE